MRFWIGFGLLLLGLPSLTWARDFHFCSNYSLQKLYLAYGYQKGSTWVSQGWFVIYPGRCVPMEAQIEQGKFYYFAYTEFKDHSFEGDQPLCVAAKPFTITTNPGQEDCEARGHYTRNFKAFDLDPSGETRLFLEPVTGPELKAVPYAEATPIQLKEWADKNDRAAQNELNRRKAEDKDKIIVKPKSEDILEEAPPEQDKGAFTP